MHNQSYPLITCKNCKARSWNCTCGNYEGEIKPSEPCKQSSFKKRMVLSSLITAPLGGIAGWYGYGVTSWQFWVILAPIAFCIGWMQAGKKQPRQRREALKWYDSEEKEDIA